MNSNQPTIYYCFGQSLPEEKVNPDSWSITDFLLKSGDISLYKTEDEAWNAMQGADSESYYYASCCNMVCAVKVNDEMSIQTQTINGKVRSLTQLDNLVPLSAIGGTKPHSARYNATQCRYTDEYFTKALIDHSSFITHSQTQEINKILTKFSDMRSKYSLIEDKKYLFKLLEQQTLLLLATQLQEYIKNKKSKNGHHSLFNIISNKSSKEFSIDNDLQLISEGLVLSDLALDNPACDEHIQKLKTFTLEKAPGKSRPWLIWGGALLSISTLLAIPITLIFISAAVLPPLGSLFILASGFAFLFAWMSRAGCQSGFAKAADTISQTLSPKQSLFTDTCLGLC